MTETTNPVIHDTAASVAEQAGVPGVHLLKLPAGPPLPIAVRNNPARDTTDPILVVFSGAVRNRTGKVGPFFSGAGLSLRARMDTIMVADPTLDADPHLSLAWYAGVAGSHTQQAIADTLASIIDATGRPLVIVGGSGGAFAAVVAASDPRVRGTVFVWNPTTNFLRSEPEPIREFLTVSCGSAWRGDDKYLHAARWLDRNNVTWNWSAVDTANLAGMLILQNATDWRVTSHLMPFMVEHGFSYAGWGTYAATPNHQAVVGEFAPYHETPPADLITGLIGAFRDKLTVEQARQRHVIPFLANLTK